MTDIWILATILQWVAIIILFSLTLGESRLIGQFTARLQTLEQHAARAQQTSIIRPGDSLPTLDVETSSGTHDIRAIIYDRSLLLLVSDGCSGCGELIRSIVLTRYGEVHFACSLVIVQLGRELRLSARQREGLSRLGATLAIDRHYRLPSAIGIHTVPAAIVVSADGVLVDASAPVSADWLYERLLSESTPRRGATPGGQEHSRTVSTD